MLNELIDNIIEIDIDEIINFNFPLDELFGLKIIKNKRVYEYFVKLSTDGNNLIFSCNNEDPFRLISSNPSHSILNQELEIKSLNEKILQKEEEISKVKSYNDFKVDALNDMVISKDGALISLTNKIEELIKMHESKDSKINELNEKIKNQNETLSNTSEELDQKRNALTNKKTETETLNQKLNELTTKNNNLNTELTNKKTETETLNQKLNELTTKNNMLTTKNNELSQLHIDNDSKIQTLITDFNNKTRDYESDIKKIKSEFASKEMSFNKLFEEEKISKQILTEQNNQLQHEINILKSTIENNDTNLESMQKEIELLKEIIAEKDKTINSLNRRA